MRKFTLFAIAALAIGYQMGYAEEINGITVSTADNPVYYTITNMRAARMSYVNAYGGGYTGGDIINADGEIIGYDNAGGLSDWLPEYLPDNSDTPQIWDFPYMGLAVGDNKFWAAFSAMPEVMDQRTIYWWFEKAGRDGVYIHNAVIDGALKKTSEMLNGRPSTSFSETAKQAYYVINLTEKQLEAINFTDEEFSTDAFALSTVSNIANEDGTVINSGSCLDMNNYITFNYEVDSPDEFEEVQALDEDGQPVYDEDGEPVMVEQPAKLRYGFAGVNRAWNPLNPGSNDNVRINNGSLFKVVKVDDVNKVQEAIESYRDITQNIYVSQAMDIFTKAKEDAVNKISGLKNIPELFPAQAIDAIIDEINSSTIDVTNIHTQADVDILDAELTKEMTVHYYHALSLAGDGTVISLQQMLALRDWPNVEDGVADNIGNAYLSSSGFGVIRYNGSMEEIGYPAVTCLLQTDESCYWTLEWVANQGYRLKNGDNYIRQYGNWGNMEDLFIAQLDDEDFMQHIDSNVMTWALTTDPNLAAIFTFSGNSIAIQDINFNEYTQELVDIYGKKLGYNVEDEAAPNYLKNTTNIAHLQSIDPMGFPTYLRRDSGNVGYIIDSWNDGNQYFAAPNCWKIKKETPVAEIPTPPGEWEELNGIIASTAENPCYYTISNMRAARMSYVNGYDGGYTGGDIINADGEIIGYDNAGGLSDWLPEYLPDNSDTPQIWDFPYMGLAVGDNKFWTAFSAMPEVMDQRTIYWWFEKAGRDGVYIHNAVIDGALKKTSEMLNGRPSVSFSETAKQAYYVINLTEKQLEAINFTDEEFSTDAFALSTVRSIANEDGTVINSGSCLDMNNYITFNYEVDSPDEFEEVQALDEDGQPVYDEDGEPVMVEQPAKLRYGFAGVNRAWNPLNPGSNDNVRINNGALFKIESVKNSEDVKLAIEDYKRDLVESYRRQVNNLLESAKKNTIERFRCLSKLPALYGADKAEKLDAIIASINNIKVDVSNVYTPEDVDVMDAQINSDMEAQYLRALALAGNGTIIRLQQMLALRDWPDVEDGVADNIGNAYLSANGIGKLKYDGSLEEMGYPAVTCLLQPDESCDWTMEWVPGHGYRLKNGENYIRQHGNWYDMEDSFMKQLDVTAEFYDDDDDFWYHVDGNVMTWALTTDPNLAAIFSFSANANYIQNIYFSEYTQEIVDVYSKDLGYDIEDKDAENYLNNTTNIAHIKSTDPDGNDTFLCRDNGAWGYIVDSWNAGRQYFAAPNCWKIHKVWDGEEITDGVEEIHASSRAAGIYDLQGRKVAKPGKGLYIINGVKTLIK